jgi:hypothetical protein
MELSSPTRRVRNPPPLRHQQRGISVPTRQHSKITNGSALLPGIDQRSAWVRRCKDVIASHVSDLGGEANCSAAEHSIIRRAAVMTVELERLESQFAVAGEADADALDQYSRVASNMRRLLESVGIKRRPREIQQTLSQYLADNSPTNNSPTPRDGE